MLSQDKLVYTQFRSAKNVTCDQLYLLQVILAHHSFGPWSQRKACFQTARRWKNMHPMWYKLTTGHWECG